MTVKGVGAVGTAIGIAKDGPALCIYVEIVKVEKITRVRTCYRATYTSQANVALLDRIVRRRID